MGPEGVCSCLTLTSLGLLTPQPPDSQVSHAGLAGSGHELCIGGAVWAVVEDLPQAAIVEGLQFCEGP